MSSTFKIVNVVTSANALSCDLLPAAHFSVEGGTREMCEQILRDLGRSAELESFETTSFCSPYFSFSTTTFRDQFVVAYHVSMSLRLPPSSMAPYEIRTTTARDLSASRDRDTSWVRQRVLLIGDFTRERWVATGESALASLGGALVIVKMGDFLQTRIDLGEREVESDATELLHKQTQLGEIASSVSMSSSMLLTRPVR